MENEDGEEEETEPKWSRMSWINGDADRDEGMDERAVGRRDGGS